MKKRGFTLVELLAVVVIISLLLLLVAPQISQQLLNSKEDVNEASKKIIFNAAEKYTKDYNINMHEADINCIPIQELIDEEYLSETVLDNKAGVSIKEKKSVKVEYTKDKYNYDLEETSTCEMERGMLGNGLIPVTYENGKWIVASSSNKNNEWYDYDKQKWANAVTLLPGVAKEVGDEVKVDGTEASMMLVWIPRYEYKYTNLGDQYAGGTASQPGGIGINFISKETTTPSSNEYKIHPAFTFDGEKSGFWVGKFELSHTTKSQGNDEEDATANLNCTTASCVEAQYLRTLPNKPSLRYNNVSNFWYGIKSIENTSSFGLSDIDIHMMKNSEWGAVAYLSQSKYGKYGNVNYEGVRKEVYQNKSFSYITGSSNGTTSQAPNHGQCTYDETRRYEADNLNTMRDKYNCGIGASTTGNIYGVYDMNGGSEEYVMGVYGDSSGIYSGTNSSQYNSGFNGRTGYDNGEITNGTTVPDPKYYDEYTTNTTTTACNNGVCFGHGLSETAGWYINAQSMVASSFPWLIRGGHNSYGQRTGVFCFSTNTGVGSKSFSTRVVGFGKN